MPVPPKPGPAQSLNLAGSIPSPPKLPQEMIDRFPELAGYQSQMDDWWSVFSTLLQRDRDNIQSQMTYLSGQISVLKP